MKNLCHAMIKLLTILFFMSTVSADDVPKSKEVKCVVCKSIVYEIHKSISKVDPKRTVQVGSFRLDADGDQKKTPKKYAGSEMHMTEVLESLCETFKDYVQARHKETNILEAIKIIEDGKMNPHFSDYDLVKDPDLNKGVKFHCQSIVEDYEDQILEYFPKYADLDIEESKNKFCKQETDICLGLKDEL